MLTLFTRHNPNENSFKTNDKGVFFYLLLLTGFFFLLEISFFILINKAYFSDFTFVSSQIHIPLSILPGILFFILVQIGIHFCFCLFCFALVYYLAEFFQLARKGIFNLAISIWCFELIFILIANQFYFPNSKFALLTSTFLMTPSITTYLFFTLLVVNCLLVMCSIISLLTHLTKPRFLFVLLILLMSYFFIFHGKKNNNTLVPNQPNIIIVGVDSLRPDFLSYFGHENSTPFLDSFLTKSSVFSEAITPLARTFPSWTSILTGQYPKKTGIRFNLADQDQLDVSNALPVLLKRYGYETIYAADETRFSNVDKKFGFDRVITPPIGLNDFLLGSFNDFPLSNLLVNTKLGYYLLPYSYANRPAYVTYEPNTFLHLLKPILQEPRIKPLFLIVHGCLPHFPYLWASSDAEKNIVERYDASVQRIDLFLRDLFTLFQENSLLKNAIVVLLSDHGEALALPGDRITEKDSFLFSSNNKVIPKFYPASLDEEALNQTAGHGTDVLGLSQYHSLLAFRLYGPRAQKGREVSGLVSLMDIKPTILDLIGLKTHSISNGQSLASVLTNQHKEVLPETIFLESDYTPDAIRTVYPEVRKVLLEGVQLFRVNPKSTRLTVKPSMGKMIIESKQYAEIKGEWMLALYPQNKSYRMPILINLNTGQWTNNLHSDFALKSPAQQMLIQLKAFYGEEIGLIKEF